VDRSPAERAHGRLTVTACDPTSAAALAAAARGVVFDKDGTLFDLDARWLPYFESFIDGVADRCDDPSLGPVLSNVLGVDHDGLIPDRPAAIDTGAQLRDLVVEALVTRGRDPVASLATVAAAADAARLGELIPLGDVDSGLRGLAATGRRLGVATSDGRENTIAELEQSGFIALFETLRCGDDLGPVKPDPHVLWSIADEWGMAPSEMLYVGDNRHDLATARSAGVPFVAVCRAGRDSWPIEPGHAQVRSVDELV
jgi:phosphoglycolate phosphatase